LTRPIDAVLTRLRQLSGRRAGLAAFLLGLLAAACLPPLPLVPVLLVSIPGLIALIDGSRSWRGAAWRGMAFGMGLYLAGLYWITEAILVRAAEFWWAVPVTVPAVAAILSMFLAVACAASRLAAPGWRRAAVLAGVWVLGDLARQFVMTGFPWNLLGSAWEMPGFAGNVFIQPASWIGVHGLTLFTLLLAASPGLAWRGRTAGLLLLAAWAAFGFVRLQVPAGAAPDLRVVIVQGNIPETDHLASFNNQDFAEQTFAKHLSLTRAGVRDALAQGTGPLFVVWPETASLYALETDAGARRAIAQAASPAVASLVGTPRFIGTRAHNSLVAVAADGSVAGIYDKFHLVPYGEYSPSYLPVRLGDQGWSPGPGLVTLHFPTLPPPGLPPIGPLICYEAIFPAEVVVEGDRPSLLVNITNDAWFGDSAGPRQHLAAARMRTVEEGLPMVRAANTGISAVIDAHGRIIQRLGLNRAGTLVVAIPGRLDATPASRMGLTAPFFLATACCAAGFGLGRKRMVGSTGWDVQKNGKKLENKKQI